jgi:hypothetical protein
MCAGCNAPAPAQVANVPPIPSGDARFWFYREFFPDDTKDMPPISINNTPIGYALAGTSFYRDMPAGTYHLSVESIGTDLNQSQDAAVGPGQQVYVKIASQPNWEAGNRGAYRRGTYYVMLISPHLASLEIPLTRYTGGS